MVLSEAAILIPFWVLVEIVLLDTEVFVEPTLVPACPLSDITLSDTVTLLFPELTATPSLAHPAILLLVMFTVSELDNAIPAPDEPGVILPRTVVPS